MRGQRFLHVRVIEAEHREAVERDLLDELDERVLELLVRAVVVEVLGVDVRDDGDRRREPQERAVALVGLGDEQVARAEARVRAERRHAPPTTTVGSKPGGAQHGRDERRRRRLAVRAGDGDAVLHAHQLGEHLGARDDRDAERARLWISGFSGSMALE